jgi:hypothetical protein
MDPFTIAQAGISVAGMVSSFSQAARQQRMYRKAEENVAKYMAEARKRLEVNVFEALQVPLQGYEMASQINMASSRQSIEALRESGQRAIAGGIGRVQEVTTRASEDLRMEMQRDLFKRDEMIAREEQRLSDMNLKLDLGEVTGAQQAMADSEKLRSQSVSDAFGQGIRAVSDIRENTALFKKGQDSENISKIMGVLGTDQVTASGLYSMSQNMDKFGDVDFTNNDSVFGFYKPLVPNKQGGQ